MRRKITIGLSGGVDSAVAAALLKEQGDEVTAVHLVCYREPGCRADQDRKDALAVALKLGIPFKVLDFRKEYQKKVLAYFYREYRQGRTPNPDIICNQEIKFGLFYQWAISQGFDRVATGHYAKIINSKIKNQKSKIQVKSQNYLAQSKDKDKDQTYFLYRLKPEQLEHLLFPLGDLTKAEVRQIAREKKLSVADKKDSTGICFIGELNLHHFLKEQLGEKEGEVVDSKGRMIGRHLGYWFFTIGQRGGWQLLPQAQTPNMERLYVIAKNKRENRIIVGPRKEVMRSNFSLVDVHWIGAKPVFREQPECWVRIRHRGRLFSCKVREFGKRIRVKVKRPVFGVAPGQSTVFYAGGQVMGGGVIAEFTD